MNLIQRCEKARNEFYERTLRLPNVIVLGKAEQKELEDYVYMENKQKEEIELQYAMQYKHQYIPSVLHDPSEVETVYGLKLKRVDDESLLEVYLT